MISQHIYGERSQTSTMRDQPREHRNTRERVEIIFPVRAHIDTAPKEC